MTVFTGSNTNIRLNQHNNVVLNIINSNLYMFWPSLITFVAFYVYVVVHVWKDPVDGAVKNVYRAR